MIQKQKGSKKTVKKIPGMRRRYYGKQPSGEPFVPPTNPNTDSYLKLQTHKTGTMLQESFATEVPHTKVTAIGQPVGMIYDVGLNTNPFTTNGPTGTEATLSSFQELNASLYFGSKRPLIYNSLDLFKFFHGDNESWSIQMKIGLPVGTDGTNMTVLTTNDTGNSLSFGIVLRRSSGNVMQLFVQRGTSGTSMISHTHSLSVTASTGVISVQVNVNGTGVSSGSMRVNGVTEVFDVLSGIDSDSTSNLLIGGSSPTTPSNVYIADVDIKNRVLSNDELSDFESYFPLIDTSDFNPLPMWEFNLQDTSNIWADLAKTIPITNNAKVRLIESGFPKLSNQTRHADTALVASSPTFKSSFQNGKNVIAFDGVDDNMDFKRAMIVEQGGIFTFFIVAKNEDSTFGSHLLSGNIGGTDYLVLTGDAYSGFFDDPYFALHTTNTSQVPTIIGTSTTNAVEVLAVKRNGDNITIYNGNDETSFKTVASGRFAAYFMGKAIDVIGVDWNFDGFLCYLAKYNGLISDEQIQARISELKTQFGS